MSRRTGLLLAGAVISVLLIAALIGASDIGELRSRAASLQWSWAALAAALAVLSYACIAGTQHALLRLLGIEVPRWPYVRLAMASVVVARTVRSGGTSGLAFLALVLSRRGVPVVATVSMGLGCALVNACVATGFVVTGMLVQTLQPGTVGSTAAAGHALGAAILLLGLGAAWVVLTRDGVRRRLLGRLARTGERLAARWGLSGWGTRIEDVGERVSGSARQLLRHPVRAWRAWAWAVLRLTVSVLSLAACARAAGLSLPVGTLLLAFIAMKMAGTVAIGPAGLGVVDGSLAGALTLLGTPYEAAVLVAALHRLAYHVTPAVASLALAGPLLRDVLAARKQPEEDGGSASG